MSTPSETVVESSRQALASRPRRRDRSNRTKRPPVVRVALWTLLAVVLTALGIGGWALNRFVIDHVEISDVNSYESSVNADTSEAPIATFSVVPTTELPQAPRTRATSRSR